MRINRSPEKMEKDEGKVKNPSTIMVDDKNQHDKKIK
jgi:hypothetical protein